MLEYIRTQHGEFVTQDDPEVRLIRGMQHLITPRQKSLLLLSWGRLGEVLGEVRGGSPIRPISSVQDFAPYLSLQLPLLLHMLQLTPQLLPLSGGNCVERSAFDA